MVQKVSTEKHPLPHNNKPSIFCIVVAKVLDYDLHAVILENWFSNFHGSKYGQNYIKITKKNPKTVYFGTHIKNF